MEEEIPTQGEFLLINCHDLSEAEKETLTDMLMQEQDGA